MTVTADLFRLQSLDIELEAKQGALTVLQGHLTDGDGLEETRNAIEEARRQLRELESTEKDLELQDEELSSHLAEMERKLYSGRINNPKELGDLNADVAMLKRRRTELDEQVLVLMDEVEAARKNLASAESQLKASEEEVRVRHSSMTADRDETLREIVELQELRAGQASQLPASALGHYDTVRQRRRPAVASVDRGVCTGCRVQIPDPLVKQARRELAFCSSCNRILFVV